MNKKIAIRLGDVKNSMVCPSGSMVLALADSDAHRFRHPRWDVSRRAFDHLLSRSCEKSKRSDILRMGFTRKAA